MHQDMLKKMQNDAEKKCKIYYCLRFVNHVHNKIIFNAFSPKLKTVLEGKPPNAKTSFFLLFHV